MFAPVLPILFPVAIFNFTLTYWIDKTLILRFYRTPKNHDETNIAYTTYLCKYAFLWHALLGFFALSNNSILTSDTKTFEGSINSINTIAENWFG